MKSRPGDEGLINNVDSEEVILALRSIEADPRYLTVAVKRYNTARWPDNQISFIDFHLEFLKTHPKLDPLQYVSNLRLILKKSAH